MSPEFPFRGEVIFTKGGKKTKRVRGGTYTVNVPDSYKGKTDVEETQAEINAVKTGADVALSLYPPTALPYTVGKFATGVVEDVQNKNINNTFNNVISYAIPKFAIKAGMKESTGNVLGVGAGVLLEAGGE